MKYIKYYVSIVLSLVSLLSPILGVLYYINTDKTTFNLVVGIIIILTGMYLNKPMQVLRVKMRYDVEYDEFGRSKNKGQYEYLSKKERDSIDIQKTMDMERIMDSSIIKRITKKGSVNPFEDMNKLIGLTSVKQKMKEMTARMEFEQLDKKKKGINNMSGRHMVFYGNPGTGKTTVARIITGFLYKYGYIKENKCVEIDGNFLKAGSDTSIKTELIIRQAFNGVLFVDEAYALLESGDASGEQAIATLIKQMEDNRDKFILILAGYTNEMQALLNANPGFKSRIKEYLYFSDYNGIEMREIFTVMANEQNFVIKSEAYNIFDERILKERKLNSFGNARTVRNILEEAIDKHAYNYVNKIIDENCKYVLCKEDINKNIKRINF